MTATNAPSHPAQMSAEQKAHEPSMDDILASIRRIISDDDALPLSRRARAAARVPAPSPAAAPAPPPPAAAPAPQAAPAVAAARSASDAFFGLGQRLVRDSEAFSPETPPIEPPPVAPARASAPIVAPRPVGVPSVPTAPPPASAAARPVLARPAPAVAPPAPVPVQAPPAAAKISEPVVVETPEPIASSAPAPTRVAPHVFAPVSPRPPLKLREFALKNFVSARPTSPVEAPVAAPPAAPQAAAPVTEAAVAPSEVAPAPTEDVPAPSEVLALRPSLDDAPAPVEPPKASVLSLTPRLTSLSDTRLKIAPLNFRTPVFRAPPKPAAPAEDNAPRLAAVAEPVAEIRPERPVEPEPMVEAVAEAVVAPEPAAVAAPPPAPAAVPESGLLSPTTGAKINASFEALAETLMTRDPDLVERMAREMLRPMLKAWLDDNLPIVVERLVRAEIERVARGR